MTAALWLLADGAAGVVLGCVTLLVIMVIRRLGDVAVVTWSTGEAGHDKRLAR